MSEKGKLQCFGENYRKNYVCVKRDEGSDNHLNIADIMINDLVHSNLHNAINLHVVSGGINIGKLCV